MIANIKWGFHSKCVSPEVSNFNIFFGDDTGVKLKIYWQKNLTAFQGMLKWVQNFYLKIFKLKKFRSQKQGMRTLKNLEKPKKLSTPLEKILK